MFRAPFKVVLDACVLYPYAVRDVLLQAAEAGLYQAYWSATILEEATRNLVADGRMRPERAQRLVDTMAEAFPESWVDDYEDLIPAMRNDPKDRHVAAAAVKAGAQVIVTSNLKDFQRLPSGMEAQSPDEFLCHLFDLDPDVLVAALQQICDRNTHPPKEIRALAIATGLSKFIAMVNDHLHFTKGRRTAVAYLAEEEEDEDEALG